MTRLGMLTPSSNTVLEPMTSAMLSALPEVTVHFGRFRVTEIALSPGALAQFDDGPILAAAALLADARVDSVTWNGTSASWLGFDTDLRLCDRITAATGIPASTAILTLNQLLAGQKVRRLGLVTPYTADVQARIAANYAGLGITCVAERHFGERDNYAFASIDPSQVAAAVRDVARAGVDAVAIVCTNMRGAGLAADIEAELGMPVFDSVAVALRGGMLAAGLDPALLSEWGSSFSM